MLRFFASILLFGTLWIAPLLTLCFLQAVVMPVHSEILSSSVRYAILFSAGLVIWSARQPGGLSGLSPEQEDFASKARGAPASSLRSLVFIGAIILGSPYVYCFLHVRLPQAQTQAALITQFILIFGAIGACGYMFLVRRKKSLKLTRYFSWFIYPSGNSLVRRMAIERVIGCAVAMLGIVASTHVFVWPGEAIQRTTASLLPSCWVWSSKEDAGKNYRWFLGWNDFYWYSD